MPRDTVTLRLHGDVPLDKFAEAVRSFNGLVQALTDELSGDAAIEWLVTDLVASSAVTTAQGWSPQPQTVERVVDAYADVGERLQQGQVLPYSPKVRAAANRLRVIPGGKVESVIFETAAGEAEIGVKADALPSIRRASAFGAISGRVQTVTNRGSLRFTLYDLLNDRAVSCYLAEGQQGLMLNAWGHLARVTGSVSRDGGSGLVQAVRRISQVEILEEPSQGDFLAVRGISPPVFDLTPEAAIRRIRDA